MSKNIRRGFNFKRFSILFASSFLFILSALAIASASASTTNSNESEVSVTLPEVINLRILNNAATSEIDNLIIGLNPTPNGAFTKDTFIAEASTSNSTGYTLYMTSTGKDHNNAYTTSLVNTDSSIDPSLGVVPTLPANSTITESDFRASNSTYKNKWGYSLNSVNVTSSTNNGTTTNTLTNVTNSNTITYADVPANGVSREIDEKTIATDHGLTPVTIGANVSSATPSGTYKNTLELTAIANPIPVEYSLTFNKNPNNNVPESSIENMPTTNPMTGSSLASSYDFTIPSTAPTTSTTGYVFKEWNTKADGTGTPYNPGATYTALAGDPDTENANLYAIWSQHTYEVTYNCNGGTGCPTDYSITTGDSSVVYNIPSTVPSKTNYKFTGYLGSDSTTYQPGGSITLTPSKLSVTLTAQWAENNFWTITNMQDMTPEVCASVKTPSNVTGSSANAVVLDTDGISTVAGAGNTYTVHNMAEYNNLVTAAGQPYVAQRTLYDIRGADGTGTSADPVSSTSANAQKYIVRKLADGNCWTVEDLRLPLAIGTPVEASYNDGSTFMWSPMSCSNAANCAINGTALYYSGTNRYYYNWYAATAEEGTTENINVDTNGSICPAGWRLPANYTFAPTKSFSSVTDAYLGITANTSAGYVGTLESYPLNYARTGHSRIYGDVIQINAIGLYWSSTSVGITDIYGYNDAYRFYYTTTNTWPQDYPSSAKYLLGYPVRCVAL